MGYREVFDTQDFIVTCILHLPARRALLSGTKCGSLILFSLPDIKLIKAVKTTQDSIDCIALGNREDVWVSGSSEIQLYTLDLDYKDSFRGHEDKVIGLFQHENCLYSASEDMSIIEWDISSKTPKILFKTDGLANAFDYSQKKKQIITASIELEIVLFDVNTQKGTRKRISDKVWALKFVLNFIVAGQNNGALIVFDQNLEKLKEIELHESRIKGIDSNGAVVVTCSFDCEVKVVRISDWTVVSKLSGHSDWIRAIGCVDKVIFSAGDDKKLIRWDIGKNYGYSEGNESDDEKQTDYKKWALVAGVVVGGAVLLYANRELFLRNIRKLNFLNN